jgi:hypothetical protein
MTAASHITCDATQPAPGGTVRCACCGRAADASARTQRHLAALDRLVEIGMAMAEKAMAQMQEAQWLGVDGPPMVDMIMRGVRRTVALSERLQAEEKRAPGPLRGPVPIRAAQPAEDAADEVPIEAVIAEAAADRHEPASDERDDAEDDLHEPLDDPNDTMPRAKAGVVMAAVKQDYRRAEVLQMPPEPPAAEPKPAEPKPPAWDGMPEKGRGSFKLSDPKLDVQIGRDTAGLPEDYWQRTRGNRGPP